MSSDRETTRRVRSWLEAGVTEIPERVLDDVLDQLPTTPQRRPFWPVRRDAEMSTYARLGGLAAALIVVVVAGTALMLGGGIGSDPTGAPSPLPTLEIPTGAPQATTPQASDAALLPGEFTACVPQNGPFKTGTRVDDVVSTADGDVTIERTRGYTWRGTINATDARLSGTHYYSWDGNGYSPGAADPGAASVEGLASWAEGHRIENDEGAWHGSTVGVTLPDGTEEASPAVLIGEGAYAGLTAVLLVADGPCFFDFRGLVMEVPDPPVPFTDG
jgi:hypothetical protein